MSRTKFVEDNRGEDKQINFVGHIIRKGEVEEISLSGKLLGSRGRSRQRKMFLEDFKPRDLESGQRSPNVVIVPLGPYRIGHTRRRYYSR